MWFDSFNTPVGKLQVAVDDSGVRHVLFENNRYDTTGRSSWTRDKVATRAVRDQLLAWFAGERREFDLQLNPVGTAFQLRTWHALATIPFGQTCSYAALALKIDAPKAVRAVGAANGRNPLPIILPCHRVIGSDGSLTGFGGGLATKQWLLKHENPALEKQLNPDMFAT